jgi:hypothetical protein
VQWEREKKRKGAQENVRAARRGEGGWGGEKRRERRGVIRV